MIFSWGKMTVENYARFQMLMGSKVIKSGQIYWQQVRIGFYRPLLVFEEYERQAVSAPSLMFGGSQYAVAPEEISNSFLNRIIFGNDPGYSLDCLGKNPKRQAKRASGEFVIRPILDINEFKQQAHPAYVSFYQRTGYNVATYRRKQERFSQWTDALFDIPGILILGAYRAGKLGGVSLSFVVNQTLIYATFFCDDESLRLHLSDLMLHTLRESAAASTEIREIFVSMHKGGGGLDDFYMHRGAKLARHGAWLQLNPVVRLLLKNCFPKQYTQLLGTFCDGRFLNRGN